MSTLLTGVIGSFQTGTYTVTRTPVSGTYTNGILNAASTSTFSIVACVQPLTGREMQDLPEGRRADETKRVYTTTLLNTTGSGEPDTVSIDGTVYEVWKVETWPAFDGDLFYKAFVSKIS